MDLQKLIEKKLEATGWSRRVFPLRADLTQSAISGLLQPKCQSASIQTLKRVWPVLYGTDSESPALPEPEQNGQPGKKMGTRQPL